MELCLGTVQFGMQYGARKAKVCDEDAKKILRHASTHDITHLDTASAYGSAEEVLGSVMQSEKIHFDVISKYASSDNWTHGALENAILNSAEKLGQKRINGYLLHRADDLSNEGLFRELCECKKNGLTENVGVSVYSPSEAMKAASVSEIDYIQVPYNILDTRLDNAGFFEKAKQSGKTVFVRSAFLQGVLLMDEWEMPECVRAQAGQAINCIKNAAAQAAASTLNFLLSFMASVKGIDYLVVGVENYEQYVEIQENCTDDKYIEYDYAELRARFESLPESVLNPAKWR